MMKIKKKGDYYKVYYEIFQTWVHMGSIEMDGGAWGLLTKMHLKDYYTVKTVQDIHYFIDKLEAGTLEDRDEYIYES